MTHKVHPTVIRLGINKNWESRWFNFKKMPKYLEQDFIVRQSIKNQFKKDSGIESVEIERLADVVNIIIKTSRPGLLIGRKGETIELLKKKIEKNLNSEKKVLKFQIKEIKNFSLSASLIAQSVALQIEKRLPFRTVLKKMIEKVVINKEIKGIRIMVAGRLNGVEIARTEWLQKGNLPRQTFVANIDYAQSQAYCSYGVIGVKVWLHKIYKDNETI